MERVITAHISNVMEHYKGQCYSWYDSIQYLSRLPLTQPGMSSTKP